MLPAEYPELISKLPTNKTKKPVYPNPTPSEIPKSQISILLAFPLENSNNDNTLTLNGGQIQIANVLNTASSLGFYKIIHYFGIFQGTGLSSLTLPATANNIAYTFDTTHDPGFIDLHRGYLGDVDDSGFVDINDLAILAANWQTGITSFGEAADTLPNTSESFQQAVAGIVFDGSTPVPEPTTLPLLAVLALLPSRRFPRRQSHGN